MYNRRLQGPWMRAFKDMGISPFIVAGRNFNRRGIDAVTGNPMVKATSTGAALQMRLTNMAGTVLTVSVVPMILNTLTTGTPMGRPDTPLGAWDLGRDEDERGQHKILDLADLTGHRRGMRVTGLNALVDGMRSGHTVDQIYGKAGYDMVTSQLHPWLGPGLGFLLSAGFGKRTDLRGNMEMMSYPGQNTRQTVERFRAAMESQNPLVYSAIRPLFQEMGLDQKPAFSHETGKLFEKTGDNWTAYGANLAATFLRSPIGAVGMKQVYPARSAAEQMVADIRESR
jgi:hypothetical protein